MLKEVQTSEVKVVETLREKTNPHERPRWDCPISCLKQFFQRAALALFLMLPGCAGSPKPQVKSLEEAGEQIVLRSITRVRADIREKMLRILIEKEEQYAIVEKLPILLQPSEKEKIAKYLLLRKDSFTEEVEMEAQPFVQRGDEVRVLLYGEKGQFGEYLSSVGNSVKVRVPILGNPGRTRIEYFKWGQVVPKNLGTKLPPPPENTVLPAGARIISKPGKAALQVGDLIRVKGENYILYEVPEYGLYFVPEDPATPEEAAITVLNPGVRYFLGEEEKHIRAWNGDGQIAYVGNVRGFIWRVRVTGKFYDRPVFLEPYRTPNYPRIPQGDNMEAILSGKIPKLTFDNNNFYRIDNDVRSLKEDEIVYVLPGQTNKEQITVVVMTLNGEKIEILFSDLGTQVKFYPGSSDEDTAAIRKFKAEQWNRFKRQLAFAGMDVSSFPDSYPEVLSYSNRTVVAASRRVKMMLDGVELVLGITNANGSLSVNPAEALACKDIGPHSQAQSATIKVEDGQTEIPLDDVAHALMSPQEIERYREHVVADGTAATIGPSLRYLWEFPDGCMTGRIRASVAQRLARLYQGVAEVDQERLALPSGLCREGENELTRGRKFYFGRQGTTTRIVTPDGRCEGEIDQTFTSMQARILECIGTTEEQEAFAAMQKSPEFLKAAFAFLKDHPDTCFREEIPKLIAQYIEQNGFQLIDLPSDTTLYRNIEGSFPHCTLWKGTKVLVRKVQQDPGSPMDLIRNVYKGMADMIRKRKQMWWVTTPDGSNAGYSSSLELFGVDEEDPPFMRQYVRGIGQTLGAIHGTINEFLAREAQKQGKTLEEYRAELERETRERGERVAEEQLREQARVLEEHARMERRAQRTAHCKATCEKHFEFCKDCSAGKPIMCGGILGRTQMSQCHEAHKDCLTRCENPW